MARPGRAGFSPATMAPITPMSPLGVVRRGARSVQTSRELVEAGDIFQGAGTAGYVDEAQLRADAAAKADQAAAMQQAAGKASFFDAIPPWGWAAGAAGLAALFFFARGRGGGSSTFNMGG